MRYPIAIEVGDESHAHGVAVPDLPGCFSAGDSLDEAMANAKEAIELHLADLAERGEPVPEARTVEHHHRAAEFAGWMWALVEVSDVAVKDRAIRINITLPERLLATIDAAASSQGETRSGYLAKAASQMLAAGRVANQAPELFLDLRDHGHLFREAFSAGILKNAGASNLSTDKNFVFMSTCVGSADIEAVFTTKPPKRAPQKHG